MEPLQYNYFGAAVPQFSQYMGYGAESVCFQQSDGTIPASIEVHNFCPDPFNYPNCHADPQTGFSTSLQASASPRSSQHSRLPNESLGSACDMDFEDRSTRRSSTEERDSLSPAQARRKAQNRAAQRAFRERKDKHVRDLETKIDHFASHITSLQSENERLNSLLQRAQSENEMLKAKTRSSPARQEPTVLVDCSKMLQPTIPAKTAPAPRQQSPRVASGSSIAHNALPNALDSDEDNLSAPQIWDLLQRHPLYLSGILDIGKVCENLREKAQSDGAKPVLSRKRVYNAIEEVSSLGGVAIDGYQL